MSELIATNSYSVVVGLGVTGLSVARFLQKSQRAFVLMDTRQSPPNLEAVRQEFPNTHLILGNLDSDVLSAASEIIVSPGVPLATPEIAHAIAAGVSVIGDVEILLRNVKAPVVAITGSNAKSTVTTLVGEMAKAAGLKVAVGGNLGTPALELLHDDVELYVLELSSFQLETVTKVNAKAATILNISEDHLDRYDNMRAYILAKMRVYFGAENFIVNRKDVLAQPPMPVGKKPIYFGGAADFGGFGVMMHQGEEYLAKNLTPLMPVAALKIRGRHNIDNALAALALGDAVNIPMSAMLQALETFKGLRHRCEWVRTINDVEFYNDSKGTNIGATIAAIEGLSRVPHKIFVIAGGEGKDQNFSELAPVLADNSCELILIGRDAQLIARSCESFVPVYFADSLKNAVEMAIQLAKPRDIVLLSPACASLDMFKNYADRGEQFCKIVNEVIG